MKFALVIMVIIAVAVLLGLLFVSFKMLRKVQVEEAEQAKLNSKQYRLHPKLQQEFDKKNKEQDKN
ncbi:MULTISPECIES: hypothetical protein [unclassified Acinetobacter]|uniref:hypothetical protein n=1 Tax=Acinetobacter TaxID=469 RepID=UPI0015D1D000|nr:MULTISPECIES: hypothetical protein [unclassified Acinetobacter]UUS64364.1 hypothetical protein MST18_10930 [Acinetobacter sp. YH12068_T]